MGDSESLLNEEFDGFTETVNTCYHDPSRRSQIISRLNDEHFQKKREERREKIEERREKREEKEM